MTRRCLVVAAIGWLAIAACSDGRPAGVSSPTEAPEPFAPAAARLAEVGGSGVTGTATLTRLGPGSEDVIIEVRPSGGRRAAAIRPGPCPGSEDGVDPLSDVVDGRSETHITRSIRGLANGNFVIVVHRTADPASEVIACGAIAQR